jgi:hypothetical protein
MLVRSIVKDLYFTCQKPPVPWKSVLTSWQFTVGYIAAVGNDWGFHTFMTLGPKYLKGALGFDIEKVI